MAAPPTDSFQGFQTNITEAKAQSTTTNGNPQSRGPSPNRGASVPDNEAAAGNPVSQKSWLSEEGIDKSKRIILRKLSHMRYQHEDLDQITTFLRGNSLESCRRG